MTDDYIQENQTLLQKLSNDLYELDAMLSVRNQQARDTQMELEQQQRLWKRVRLQYFRHRHRGKRRSAADFRYHPGNRRYSNRRYDPYAHPHRRKRYLYSGFKANSYSHSISNPKRHTDRNRQRKHIFIQYALV